MIFIIFISVFSVYLYFIYLVKNRKEMMELNPQCNCENCELKPIFFESVEGKSLDDICSWKYEKEFLKGAFITKQGEDIKEFIYLKSGLVKIFKKNESEKEQIICFAKPLDFVSLLSVFSNKNYNYSIVAIEDSVTCNLNFEKLKKLIKANGNFAYSLLSKVSLATDKIILSTLEIKQKQTFGKVAYILLFFLNEVYKSSSFELPVSRKEIADHLGTTTENVIRTLSSLRQDGIIKIYGKLIEVVDKERLQKICDFS
jgi:CRP-like cAMP-binding protein